ncbi:hypothetical protein GCM10007887_40630 [Methylobacterium haplocladii]|uniref:Integrase catalytic domain-containing protein n=1 Tax=Methylobacterium haplocladii TaxID=1176176 RepID=A0A512IW35_9HYPH|nr:hypothetical protein MHA02_43140 [Methylobacterium haplocladii]GLS61356.1 hypothetical protein GCM10007887_40630 [Methylobacterium haplocladii]
MQQPSIWPGPKYRSDHESFNDKLKDQLSRQEIFYSLKEAQIVIGLWQNTYTRVRPPASLRYRPCACHLPESGLLASHVRDHAVTSHSA